MTDTKKPIAHFEDKYLIHNDGSVQSLQDYKFIRPSQNPNGYWKVSLGLNGKRKQMLVHQLVARHFIPNPYGYEQVNHMDGDKSNNHFHNLEWISREGNIQHSLETGLRKGFLSIKVKEELLVRVLCGEKIRDLANEIGRREETLSAMLRTLAKRTNRGHEWVAAMKSRRKDVAIRNLEKINNPDSIKS